MCQLNSFTLKYLSADKCSLANTALSVFGGLDNLKTYHEQYRR